MPEFKFHTLPEYEKIVNKMAEAMKLGIHAGRLSYEAGRIPVKYTAQASSPTEGLGFL